MLALVFLRREQQRVDTVLWEKGAKGPQPVVISAGATHLSNYVSEPKTTRGFHRMPVELQEDEGSQREHD